MKKKMALLLAVVLTVAMSATVFASTGTVDIADAIGTGMTSMASEIMGVIAVILPIALGIVGAVIAIRKGISLVRGLVS
jgi:hypothetical protein